MNRAAEEWTDLDIPCMSLEQSHVWKSRKLNEAIDDIQEQDTRIKGLEAEVARLWEDLQRKSVKRFLAAHKEGT